MSLDRSASASSVRPTLGTPNKTKEDRVVCRRKEAARSLVVIDRTLGKLLADQLACSGLRVTDIHTHLPALKRSHRFKNLDSLQK